MSTGDTHDGAGPRQLLDDYVKHPDKAFDPLTQQWVDQTLSNQIFDAINCLEDPIAYLASLPSLGVSYPVTRREVFVYEVYTWYLRTKASQNVERSCPEQYATLQRLRQLCTVPRGFAPLTSAEQSAFDCDWSLLTVDSMRSLIRILLEVQPSDQTPAELYQLLYDAINHLDHSPHNRDTYFGDLCVNDSNVHDYVATILDRPIAYWEPDGRSNMDAYFDNASIEQLLDMVGRIPESNRNTIKSMTKHQLVCYFDTLMIQRYNAKREQNSHKLRKAMEDVAHDETPCYSLEYLSRSDLIAILDEFSIEYSNEATTFELSELIDDYFNLHRQSDPRIPSKTLVKLT